LGAPLAWVWVGWQLSKGAKVAKESKTPKRLKLLLTPAGG